MNLMIGVDLGGTYTKFGLVKENGELIAENYIKTDSSVNYAVFFENLINQIKNLHKEAAPLSKLKGIGIGAPSGNFLTGQIENASNLSWSECIPVAKLMMEYSGLPVAVTNDANAAALGELRYGVAKDVDNFISLTLGTGLGCGIVINGNLVTGQNGHAGELGHTIAVENGRHCGCGRNGCLETYASAPGLRHTLLELLTESDQKSVFSNKKPGEISAKDITREAAAGDELSKQAFTRTGEILGRKLADTVAFLNPSLIVISGGLANSGNLILEPTRFYLEENLLEIFKGSVTLKLSEMTKKNAAILGAAALMWEQNISLSDAQYV
ncbi:ROK family protein [soil metagenome]